MRQSRGAVIQHILKTIIETGLATSDLIAAILESPYGSSYGRLTYKMRQLETERNRRTALLGRKRIHVYLSRLKKQGLISHNKSSWKIARAGKKRLVQLKKKFHFSFLKTEYKKEKSNEIILVSFDIPEKEKYKRDWLRRQLQELGFTLLQKSVWMGKIALPEEFISNLN